MGLGARLLGDGHGHADDASGGLIRRARLYEIFSAAAFAGRRRRVFDRLAALSGAIPGDRVLDVGCGTGFFATRLAAAVQPGGRVDGIDPSPPMIDYAAGRGDAHCVFTVAGVGQGVRFSSPRSPGPVTRTVCRRAGSAARGGGRRCR